jgi:ferric-dicitrate binding protein FerR (iron transport regulator)
MQTNELYSLFHKRWTQQITKEEAGQLSALMQDEKIRESHDQLYSYWQKSEDYRPNIEFSADNGLARFKERIALEQSSFVKHTPSPKIMRMKPPVVLFRLAAVFLFVLFAGFAVYNYLSNQTVDLITDNSSVQFVDLPDGSKIWLNVNSVLSYPAYNLGDRTVELKGEAYFEVEPDASRPFIVHTTKVDVKVVGTAFNLNSQAGVDLFELQVDEGLVEVQHASVEQNVAAKEQLILTQDQEWVKSDLESLNSGAWRNKILRFENVSLDQVFKELETCYKISIDKSVLPDLSCKFTSPINRSIGDVIQALKTSFPDLIIDGPDNNKYVLSGNACG